MDAPHKPEPLSVVPQWHGQFAIENNTGANVSGRGRGSFEERYVSFSGYFGSHGPQVFAAAPELLFAAQRLAARGFFTPTACADKATLKDMESMLAAIAKATGATK